MKVNKKRKNKDIPKDYTKDKFLKDLKKVCQPVNKSGKQQPSSYKT